jgi:RNA:NAD 2'-phosphotransferase (TPT1/KptA family)
MNPKLITRLLRHVLTEEIEEDGTISISTFLLILERDYSQVCTLQDLLQLAEQDNKQRIQIDLEKATIRARNGHSIKNVQTSLCCRLLSSNELKNKVVIHATDQNLKEKIQSSGLLKMNRIHIHFATNPKFLRKNKNLFLKLKVDEWLADGHKLYEGSRGVVLVDEDLVSSKYLEEVEFDLMFETQKN